MKKHRKPLNRSITVGCLAFILALCALLSAANLALYQRYVFADYRNYISDILDLTMSRIDADDLARCVDTLEESEQYKQTLLFMDSLMDHFGDIHYFYAIKPLNTDDTANVMSVLSAERYQDRYVDTEGNLYLGWISDDEFDAKTAAMFMDIMDGEETLFFEESTEWGTDYTGARAIRDSQGRGVAVLAVDIDISFINGMVMRYAAVNICVIAALGALFIGIFLLWSTKNITRPIKQLEQSAVHFADHSHGQRSIEALSFEAPELKTDNEIKSLSNAVIKMTDDMRDYVYDIVNAETRAANFKALAVRDALTGVRNKTAYDREIRAAQIRLEAGEKKLGLAIADLNYLKKINDTYGHDKGNIAIQKLCGIICTVFCHSPVFRLGGDEFAIILRGNDYDNCDRLIARFEGELAALAADDALDPWEKVSAAIGVAFYDPNLDGDIDDLFRRADRVMYERKKAMRAERVD